MNVSLTSRLSRESQTIREALSFKRGVGDEKFTQLEQLLGTHMDREVVLHDDFKSLYRIINGQKLMGQGRDR